MTGFPSTLWPWPLWSRLVCPLRRNSRMVSSTAARRSSKAATDSWKLSWSTFPTVTRSGNRPSKMENAKLLKWTIQNEVTGQNEKTRKTWDDHPGDLKPQHYFVALMEDSTQIVHSLHGPKDIFPTKVHWFFLHLLVREIRVLRYLNLTKTRLPQHFVQASRQASL